MLNDHVAFKSLNGQHVASVFRNKENFSPKFGSLLFSARFSMLSVHYFFLLNHQSLVLFTKV